MRSRFITGVIATIILFIVCFFTAQVFIMGFGIHEPAARWVMVAALVMPLLYIGSFSRGRNVIRCGFKLYTTINVIAGIFFYLFLGAIVFGLISIGFLIFGSVAPMIIPWTIIVLAILAALVGLIEARTITVTEYKVSLPNLPASWHGKKAVLVSDTHFGLVNYKKFADKIVTKILSLKPDFVLHAGDFYDGPVVPTAVITEAWKKLTAEVPLFYTPGNHETYGDYEMFVNSVRAADAVVLDNKLVVHDGVQIAGILYHGGKENPEVAKTLSTMSFDGTKPLILINHPPTAFMSPVEHGVNLMVSGHTHRGQFWPCRYITRKIYGQYDYGMHPYNNDMTVITTRGVGTAGPPMRLFNNAEIVLITFTAK